MCETLIFKYDRVKYNFFDKIQEIFKLKISLEAIHTLSSTNTNEQVLFSNDTTTELQKHFYNSDLYNDFCILYYDFVKNEIGKLFPNEEYLVVQKDPGFRVSLPNNTARIIPCFFDSEPTSRRCPIGLQSIIPTSVKNFAIDLTSDFHEGMRDCSQLVDKTIVVSPKKFVGLLPICA